MIDNILDKYITEDKKFVGDVGSFISSKVKSGKWKVEGVPFKVVNADGTLIFEYPSDAYDITLKLLDTCDKRGLKYQQIGLRSKNNMKFIVEL